MRLKNLVSVTSAIFLLVAAATLVTVVAQTSQPSPTPSPTPTISPSPVPATPKVIKLDGNLELDDLITVDVDHLADWAATHDATKLVPFINGLAVRGNYPQEIHTEKNRVQFHLEITAQNKKVWTDLLGAPAGMKIPVTFSVGLENQTPFDSLYGEDNQWPLTVISTYYGVESFLLILFTLILFLWLARKTTLIREPGAHPPEGSLPPYNLGRTQMAFWFFLIYVSYIVIWLITGALDTITASLLGLMGISAGTALGEAMIDNGKEEARTTQLKQLTAEKQTLEQTIPEMQSQLLSLSDKSTLLSEDLTNRDSLNQQMQTNRTRLAVVNQENQALARPATAEVSKGFLQDILSDASGYSFHRFQIFAWTIVLGIMFVSSVYNSLAMPDFSTTLLGLMGLSSGTYIGFKFPEKK
ncbi:MAG TPA: hypothetical protein VN643_15565 [Pyrinomonadaceae bacterium]|nr:hypothetical protein [Pyrinomonadaceae bacterium]